MIRHGLEGVWETEAGVGHLSIHQGRRCGGGGGGGHARVAISQQLVSRCDETREVGEGSRLQSETRPSIHLSVSVRGTATGPLTEQQGESRDDCSGETAVELLRCAHRESLPELRLVMYNEVRWT